jgi:hypothetical protein
MHTPEQLEPHSLHGGGANAGGLQDAAAGRLGETFSDGRW